MATYLQVKIKEKYSRLREKYCGKVTDNISARDIDTYFRLKRNYIDMFPYQALKDPNKRIDYELKSIIFDKFAYELKAVRKHRYWEYLLYDNGDPNTIDTFLNTLDDKQKLQWQSYILTAQDLKYHNEELYNEMIKIVNADRQRRLRLKNRISGILNSGAAYFVTLTFSDATLENTQPHIRRKYVTELIKQVSNNYVGNVDYGAKRGREHYHIVLQTDKFNDLEYKFYKGVGYSATFSKALDEWSKNGLYFIKKCGKEDSDAKALAQYTTKLTNHAVKNITKRNTLIYSR